MRMGRMALAALVFAGCGADKDAAKKTRGAAPTPTVVVADVKIEDVPVIREFVARTEAVETISIQARVEAILERRMFEEGLPVKKGQVLYELDKRTYAANLDTAEAALAKAKADRKLADEQVSVRAAEAALTRAKALLYPSIRLTGSGGVASSSLSDLLRSDSVFYSITPSITMPIFNAGRLRANVKVTESQQRQAAMGYLQTIQQAFREVADALVAHQRTREVREYREQAEEALSDQARLSQLRYRGGVTSYLEVLDSRRDHLDTELLLAQSIRNELLSVVFLYRALGGGWQSAEGEAAAGPQTGASGVVAVPSVKK